LPNIQAGTERLGLACQSYHGLMEYFLQESDKFS
jgi:hypothetical protein